MKGVPSCIPDSKTGVMFGCFRPPASLASRTKRAWPSSPSEQVFTATNRSPFSGSTALKTAPKAPAPMRSSEAKAADRSRDRDGRAGARFRRRRPAASSQTGDQGHDRAALPLTSVAARAGASSGRTRAPRLRRQSFEVPVGDRRRARHDPHVVALGARDDRLRVVGREIRDQVLDPERPDELQPPVGIRRIADDRFRLHRLDLALEAVLAAGEEGRDRAVGLSS